VTGATLGTVNATRRAAALSSTVQRRAVAHAEGLSHEAASRLGHFHDHAEIQP
jgi:hypothetical protein